MPGMTTTLGAAMLTPPQITVFLVELAVMLGLARVLGEMCRRFRLPQVIGEIAAGVVLGQTILGQFMPETFAWLYPAKGGVAIGLEGMVTLSATLLLFVVGLEVDLSTVWRQGKAALFVTVVGIILPFSAGFGLAYALPEFLDVGVRGQQAPLPFAIFMGIAMSITALPVIAKVLIDLNMAKSDLGMLVISSAMLNDLVGWLGFAVVLALLPASAMVGVEAAQAMHEGAGAIGQVLDPGVAVIGEAGGQGHGGGDGGLGVWWTVGLTVAFVVGMLTVGRWLCHKAVVRVQAHWAWPGGVLSFVFFVALLCAAATERIGVHSILGAFIAGVAIGDSHHLRERTRDVIHQFVMNIFAPLFFASIGLRLNFVDDFNPAIVVTVFCVAATGKLIGSYAGAKLAGLSQRESWATGFGMTAQGAVGIILGQLALEAQLIGTELMIAIVVMALTTSLMAGPAMQRVLRTKRKLQLIDILTERHVLMKPTAHHATAAIRELSERAADLTGLDAQTIHDAVMERERIMHTGLPHGLAVPHARLADLSRPCVVVARSQAGVDFDSPDGEPARLIALLLTPVDMPSSQIELLSDFAHTFDRPSVRTRSMSAESATEFLAMLNQATATSEFVGHDDETLGMR
jgi:Kef-type K+ transport system membrane component KefB